MVSLGLRSHLRFRLRRALWVVLLLSGTIGFAGADGAFSYDLSVQPVALFPFRTDVFGVGFGATLRLAVPVSTPEWIRFGVETQYRYLPLRAPAGLSAVWFGMGPGLRFPRQSRIAAYADLTGGAYAGWVHGDLGATSDTGLHVGGMFRLGVTADLTPRLSLTAGAGLAALMHGGSSIDAGIELVVRTRPAGEVRLMAGPIAGITPTTGVLDGSEVSLTLVNEGRFPAETLRVTVSAPPYVDEQVIWEEPGPLRPGARYTFSAHMDISRRVMGVVQGLTVPVTLRLRSVSGGLARETATRATIRVHDRNAIVWDDDRKAALFITEKDEWVLTVAGRAASLAASAGVPPVNATFCHAAGMLHAMASLGITYVVDPVSPYDAASDGSVVDFLRFPRETLLHLAGDCDDLTVLYCALLESIGVGTALLTVPGHIFAAVDLGLSPSESRRVLYSTNALIHQGESTWIPVEVTALGDGFDEAWRAGARQVVEFQDLLGFHPVRDAWDLYPPTALVQVQGTPPTLDPATFLGVHLPHLGLVVEGQLAPLAEAVREQMQRRGQSPGLLNALGVLYARYGRLEDARELFTLALELDAFAPALVNLGNIQMLSGDLAAAQETFALAAELRPGAPEVLLAMTRVNYELGRYGECRRVYALLVQADPELASRNAFLAVTTAETRRSAEVVLSDPVTWMEDPATSMEDPQP